MLIGHEDDLRAWVREASRGAARWVEPALGSTAGLPDCWVPEQGFCVWLELKVGEVRSGHLCYEVRPEQRRELKAMVKDKVPCGLLVGIKGSRTVIFALVGHAALAGKLPVAADCAGKMWLASQTDELSGFGVGVNFIFSDFQ